VPFSYAQYTGNGSTTTFSVPFPYLLRAHVKLYTGFNILDGTFTSQLVEGAGYTWTSGTQVQTTAAVAAGVVLTIKRDTPGSSQVVTWQDGSNLIAEDQNTADLQNLYVVQEQQDVIGLSAALSNTANANAATALSTANAASTTANGIAGTANTALSNANAAVATANAASATATAADATANGIAGTANTALSNANAAVSTANAANATANGIAGTANTALSNANAAVSTANAADATANGIAATANTALSNSNAAVATANSASSAATNAQTTANAALPKAGGTMTGDLVIPSLNGGPLAGTRNRIINGDMRIAQRGTSFAAVQGYTLDQWLFGKDGAMVCTVSQSSDVPNNTFQSSIKVDVSTADTSISASDGASLQTRIEGFNVRDLIGTTFTLSFWIKSPKTGIHCVAFRNLGGANPDRSYILEFTVAVANTWEYKTLTVTGGLITAGTWDWTNGTGLVVDFTLAMGTNLQTTAGAWQTGNFLATANQVNVMDNTANDFFLTGVQLEASTVATPFERRSYGQELALCQRYYEAQNDETYIGFPCPSTGGFAHAFPFPFKVQKRASPTITYNLNNAFNVSASGVVFFNTYAWSLQVIGASFTNTTASTNFRASAEL